MPKLTQWEWAEGNIPEGLTVFGLDLCVKKTYPLLLSKDK
jgi:hypothetical protein